MTLHPYVANRLGRSRRVSIDNPEVSILMTAWNAAGYIAEAIESVIAQRTTADWELLIVDDGSTDSTHDIASRYVQLLPGRIGILQHAYGRNRGISASRNLALRHARADILGFLDADDVWLPHRLQTGLSHLHACPQAAMAYASTERWCHHEKMFNESEARSAFWGDNYIPPLLPDGMSAGLLQPGELLDAFLDDESMVPCICSVLVRTQAAKAVGGFEDGFRGLYDDQVFHAKIGLGFPVFASEECVARYRQHQGSCCDEGRRNDLVQLQAREDFEVWLAGYRSNLERKAESNTSLDKLLQV